MLPSPQNGDGSIEPVPEPPLQPAPVERGERFGPTNLRAYEEFHEGPLPPPWQLRQYNDVLPGLADRIVSMAEGQLEHGKKMDRSDLGLARLGLIFAFVLAFSGVGGGLALAFTGKESAGLGTFFLSLAALVGLFIYDRRRSGPSKQKRSTSLAASSSAGAAPE